MEYLVRISSAEPFDFEGGSEQITDEFSGRLGDMLHSAWYGKLQRSVGHPRAGGNGGGCSRMVEIAAKNQTGAYLRSFDATDNPYGMGKFWNYTALLLAVCVVSAVFLWYRHGLSGGLAALAGGLSAVLSTVSVLGIAGIALNRGSLSGFRAVEYGVCAAWYVFAQ